MEEQQIKEEVSSSTEIVDGSNSSVLPEQSDAAVSAAFPNEVENPVIAPSDIKIKTAETEEQQNSVVGSSEASESQISQSGKSAEVEEEVPQPKVVYLRKKKTVLMLSYCGQDYFGMQRNPGTKTIEDDLLQALLKAGYIDDEAYKKPQQIQFQRAARTDKHVSAARQIVSLKLPDVVDLSKINEVLPEQIRIMGMRKVTKGFDCKATCDARTYMYMIPTFAFVPIAQNVTEDYRITPEVLEDLRQALRLYLGTKNFHNFTSRKKPTDPSAKRYIISFTASDPFMKDGLEYLILRVKGQSFMLHQIRKMIGLVVAYLRGFAGKDTFTKTWTLERIDIPKAPGVGLVLDYVHYERYNKRYGSDGMHVPLTWDDVDGQVEEFCQKFIYSIITQCENEEKSMLGWLETLPFHTYDVREQEASTPLSGIGKAAYCIGKTKLKDDSSEDEIDADEDEIKAKRPRKAEEVAA